MVPPHLGGHAVVEHPEEGRFAARDRVLHLLLEPVAALHGCTVHGRGRRIRRMGGSPFDLASLRNTNDAGRMGGSVAELFSANCADHRRRPPSWCSIGRLLESSMSTRGRLSPADSPGGRATRYVSGSRIADDQVACEGRPPRPRPCVPISKHGIRWQVRLPRPRSRHSERWGARLRRRTVHLAASRKGRSASA